MPPSTIRSARLPQAALLALLTVLAAGCAAPAADTTPAPEASDPCLLPTGTPGEPRRLLVAIVRPEDTAAVAQPQPEPLIHLDCAGRPRAAAAESWSADTTGRTWILVLRRSALDVRAASAAAEWRTRPSAATTLRRSGIEVAALDERRLASLLPRPADSLPLVFAHPSLALVTDSGPVLGTTFVFRPVGADPRDALDGGADIMVSDDPDLLDYARAREELAVHPLPWNRTYVLLIPPGQQGFEDLIPLDTAGFRAELARDAVRVDARAAEGARWWESPGCVPERTPGGGRYLGRGVTLVNTPAEDPVGRAIAERLVARAGPPLQVVGGLDPRAPIAAVHSPSGLAYVVPVPHVALVPCHEITGWPDGSTVVPLIDTRRSAVVRRGLPPLTVEFDGRLRPADRP